MWFKNRARRRRAEKTRLRELEGLATAMDRSQAVAELRPNATMLRANAAFLGLTGYAPGEIIDAPYDVFLAQGQAETAEYREFWRALHRGETITRTQQLFGKGGGAVRVHAAYSPVIDLAGKVTRVAVFITDVSDLRIAVVHTADPPPQAEVPDRLNGVLTQRLEALTAGDLSTRLLAPLEARHQPVREAFNTAVARLDEVMGQIAATAGGLDDAADRAARLTSALTREAGRPPSERMEADAFLRKMTLAAARGVEGLKGLSEVAAVIRAEAGGARRAAREAVDAMDEIERSAAQTRQIVALVDEVAFQASLLSLIAGVEAARSGDVGRGFRVIAQKIEGLSERSAEAAREIKAVVATHGEHVARGVRRVKDAGGASGDIAARVARLDGLVSDLARTAQDQALGLQGLEAAIARADEAARRQAGRLGEAAAAVSEIRQGSQDLMRTVSPFRAPVAARPGSAGSEGFAPTPNAVASAHARIAAYASCGRAG